jgi:hypothetical protein
MKTQTFLHTTRRQYRQAVIMHDPPNNHLDFHLNRKLILLYDEMHINQVGERDLMQCMGAC